MLTLYAVLAVIAGQPEPAAAGWIDWGATPSLGSQAESGPTPEQAMFEDCVYTPAEDRDPACAPILEEAVALAPASSFDPPAGGAPGSNPWVEQTCARENLRPGQTTYACRLEADGLYARARLAYRALNGLPNYGRLRLLAERAQEGGPAQAAPPGDRPLREREQERCRRSGSSWRDEDSGDSGSDYRVTCSWSSDPETEGRAGQLLDDLLRPD